MYGEKNNLHWFSKIGHIENLSAGADLPRRSPIPSVPLTQSLAFSGIAALPGRLNFTQVHGILDAFEEFSFMNNAQLWSWAINEHHNQKEIT